ncbi:MAG: hypothetical protein JRD68_16770 [Deltaproteobacteria bacterium]|nr:hypothetical protein [Deltaproteobacteria bacterium]
MNFPIKPVLKELEAFAHLGFDYLELTLDPPLAHYSIIRKQKDEISKSMGVRPTQLTENRKNRLAKL